MSSATFDTYLYLTDASGQVLLEDDDGGGGTNSRIPSTSGSFTLLGTGAYTIEATSFGVFAIGEVGNYDLNIALNGSSPPPVCTAIAIGQTITGSLAATDPQSPYRPGRHANCFTLTAAGGDSAIISMNSPAIDAFLYLISPANEVLTSDDDSGGGTNARIPSLGSFVFPAAGIYTIEATSYAAGETGGYTLAVAPGVNVAGCTTISYGKIINGSLKTTDPHSLFDATVYADCYAFAGNAGDQIVISLTSNAFDAYLRVIDASTTIIAFNDDASSGVLPNPTDSQITFTLPATSVYRIEATSRTAAATGAYTLSLTRTSP
jgi:hypothetical protein